MRNNWLIIFFVIIFLPQRGWTQKLFYPGYIITNEGDTLKGKIPYESQNNNNYHIISLKDEKGFEKHFNVWQIKMYYFNQEYYFTKKAELGETEHRKNLVFMHRTDTGKIALYEYEFVKKFGGSSKFEAGGFSTSGEKHFYYETRDGDFGYFSKQKYRETLKTLMQDRAELCSEVADKSFKYEDIPLIIGKYNHP